MTTIAVILLSVSVILLGITLLSGGAKILVLMRHEQVHCAQIHELQVVVAQLANHLRGLSAEPLPPVVQQYLNIAAQYGDLTESTDSDDI